MPNNTSDATGSDAFQQLDHPHDIWRMRRCGFELIHSSLSPAHQTSEQPCPPDSVRPLDVSLTVPTSLMPGDKPHQSKSSA